MRKLLALILAVLLIGSMTGCKQETPTNPQGTTSAGAVDTAPTAPEDYTSTPDTNVSEPTGSQNTTNAPTTGAPVPTQPDYSSDTYVRDGDYIYFGSWPQTEVKDTALIAELNSSYAATLPTDGSNNGWTSYGYYISNSNETDFMWYRDVTCDGQTYRGVYFESYRPNKISNTNTAKWSYQDENGYHPGMVYWFRWDTLKWRILTEANGKALLLCEMVIDSREFYHDIGSREIDGTNIHANNYAYSNIRAWLTETFYEEAFTELQKSIICQTIVDNSPASTTDKCGHLQQKDEFACADTQEYVFLLSEYDVTDSQYGFKTCNELDTLRNKVTTAYARCQGAYVDEEMIGYWWVRSPDYASLSAHVVSNYSYPDNGNNVNYTKNGVCPALWITL